MFANEQSSADESFWSNKASLGSPKNGWMILSFLLTRQLTAWDVGRVLLWQAQFMLDKQRLTGALEAGHHWADAGKQLAARRGADEMMGNVHKLRKGSIETEKQHPV